jgi:hypothetical protein
MARMRAPSRAYLAISGLITTASGQAARALTIGMALRSLAGVLDHAAAIKADFDQIV